MIHNTDEQLKIEDLNVEINDASTLETPTEESIQNSNLEDQEAKIDEQVKNEVQIQEAEMTGKEELILEEAGETDVEEQRLTVEKQDINEEKETQKVEAEINNSGDISEIDTEHFSEEEDDTEEVVHFSEAAFEKLDLKQLLEEANEAMMLTPLMALEKLRVIRPIFYAKYHEDKKQLLETYLSENENVDEFVYPDEALVLRLNEIITRANEARREEKLRIDQEKQNNLKRKLTLLAELEAIVSSDETEQSIQKVKEIQHDWKSIKALPHGEMQQLWDKYHFLLDKFYDTHSINIELKDLDRKKNLEAKIELVKKMSELKEMTSLKKSFILMRKYHEDFKNTGPVPSESRELIWNTFKLESDAVYELKKAELNKLDEIKEANLKQKTLLVEKISLLSNLTYQNAKDWGAKTKEIEDIFEEWKTIGIVPKAKSDELWKTFRSHQNTFYENKKAFFNTIIKERNANLILKEDLCKQVEALVENDADDTNTKEVIKIQNEWKKIGPVPDKVNTQVWKRFRKACDTFFDKKKEAFKERNEEETVNLTRKQAIIDELLTLSKTENLDASEGWNQLKKQTDEWRTIGFIPRKDMKAINGKYDKLCDELFARFKKDRSNMKFDQAQNHYSNILSMPKGEEKIKYETSKIKQKITFLNDEILQMETNRAFFAKSKGAEGIFKEFEAKIDKHKEQIARLKQELKAIKDLEKTKETTEDAAPTDAESAE